jgi:para-aminobenzoate synthetase component 2
MFLVIDNYDSFVHNLARYFEIAGVQTLVLRNDKVSIKEITDLKPEALIISPGPCSPKEAGISTEAVCKLGTSIPILGVCLGHQCIGEAYGGTTQRAAEPVHGKSSLIKHVARGIFEGIPSPLQVGRYHSLIVKPGKQSPLRVTARTDEGEIMAMAHMSYPVCGLQFHPESILTQHGQAMIQNFVNMAQHWNDLKHNKAA